ncbi:MAG: diacylglycerol kinase [Fibrobacterota bacterium]|nr:diacylglycerol kinase [Fibrobacterota bacterium]
MPITTATVFLNIRSGRLLGRNGTQTARRIAQLFKQAHVEAEVHPTQPRHLAEHVGRAVRNGAEAVMVAGGDGTIRTAAKLLAGTNTPLGILPLGTRNRLARALGIPEDPAEAIRSLAAGSVRHADIGEVNGHAFVFSSMYGFLNSFGRHREDHRGRPLGLEYPAAAWSVLMDLFKAPAREVEIQTGDTYSRCASCIFIVSNNPFLPGGFGGQPRLASLDSGRLGVYVSQHQGRLGRIRLLGELLAGRWDKDPDIVRKAVPSFTVSVSGEGPVDIMNDGEFLRLRSPLEYRIRPRALRIIVPEGCELVSKPDLAAAQPNHQLT